MGKVKAKSEGKLKKKTILFCVTGSIAAYRACDLVRELKREGADVVCLMTKCAQEFVTPLTFRSLTGNQVHADAFSPVEEWNVLHTSLADRADLILIAPATANVIARLAAGFADDLVTSVVLASKAPVLIVPAMNDNMYHHPLTQENMEKLRRFNYHFENPIEGDLACGRKAVGHIADPCSILQHIDRLLN